jgi:hypothetical protein
MANSPVGDRVHARAIDAKQTAERQDLPQNEGANMAHLEIDIQVDDVSGADAAPGDYGEWTDHCILDDCSA